VSAKSPPNSCPGSASEARATERPNPATGRLDELPIAEVLARIVEEDASVAAAVQAALPGLERAAALLHERLQAGGRWFSVGAGTSGRMGLLDAAELPPTFGVDPDTVQAVLAGGRDALLHASEQAEDDPAAARADLAARDFAREDVLVALSASGHTTYVLGAVEHARELSAPSIGITCAADSPLAQRVDISLAIEVGPEVIAGSTRMKGGLAQKMVLHALSTAVMVKLGRVRGNRMTHIKPANYKLRERAVGIVATLAGVDPETARCALDAADGSIETALAALENPPQR
jgi:N-acetylmuramic acid 6-phosphate etherase